MNIKRTLGPIVIAYTGNMRNPWWARLEDVNRTDMLSNMPVVYTLDEWNELMAGLTSEQRWARYAPVLFLQEGYFGNYRKEFRCVMIRPRNNVKQIITGPTAWGVLSSVSLGDGSAPLESPEVYNLEKLIAWGGPE